MLNKGLLALGLLLLAAAAPAPIAPQNLPQITSPAEVQWPSATGTTMSNGTYDVILWTPWVSGTIQSMVVQTAGSGSPTFTIALQIGGVNVAGCNAIAVTSATATMVACTGSNAVPQGSHVTMVVTSASGTILDPRVQINFLHTVP